MNEGKHRQAARRGCRRRPFSRPLRGARRSRSAARGDRVGSPVAASGQVTQILAQPLALAARNYLRFFAQMACRVCVVVG